MSTLEQRKAALSAVQRAALERRVAGLGRRSNGIGRRPDDEPAVCSFGQERVWLLSELNPESAVTNRPTYLRLSGPLDVPALERCLNEIVRRHEALRTCFEIWDGELVPRVGVAADVPLPTADLRHFSDRDVGRELQDRARQFGRTPLDLKRGPLLKASLLRLADESHVLMINVDHIAFDGWSAGVFAEELASLYTAFSNRLRSTLPELPIQFADYAWWQRNILEPSVRNQQLAYWRKQLEGAPTQIELPIDRSRDSSPQNRGGRASLVLNKSLAASLRELGRREDATLFMTLLAAFNLLLHREAGQTDILVGTLTAGRTRLETEKLIGMFVNTLALRSRLDETAGFAELLRQTRRTALAAFENQDLPFERLIQSMKLDRVRAPLVQVLFQFRNLPSSATRAGALTIETCDFDVGVPQLELALEVTETRDGLHCLLRYDADLFNASTAERILNDYRVLLEVVVAAPERPLGALTNAWGEKRQRGGTSDAHAVDAAAAEWPLTAAQMGIWLDQRISPNAGRYNIGECWRIRGALDIDCFERALQHVVNETDALRLHVSVQHGSPVVRLSPVLPAALKSIDFRRLTRSDEEAERWMECDLAEPFDADAGRLFSFAVLHTGDASWIAYCKYHHIIMDGIGSGLIRRHVCDAYNSFISGGVPSKLSGLRWSEVVAADAAYAGSHEKQSDREFWKSRCLDLGECPTLSTRRGGGLPDGPVRRLSTTLPNELVSSLRHLGRKIGPDCPLNHVLLALWYAYLSRLTGSEEMTIALPRANRRTESARQTAGMLANVVLGRMQCPGRETLRSLLTSASRMLRETAAHERFPLTELQMLLPAGQRDSRLFTATFNYIPVAGRLHFGDAVAEAEMLAPGPCKELTLLVRAGAPEEEAVMRLVYPSHLYSAEEIAFHRDRLLHLFAVAPAHLETPVNELPVVPPAELDMMFQWNDTRHEWPSGCVHELIERQARQTPHAIAVVSQNEHLTYRALDRRANQLARRLRDLGVMRGTLVAVCLPRGLKMTVSLLGIFKAGGAYLPLDAGYPRERLEFILNDAQPAVLVAEGEVPAGLEAFEGKVAFLDDSFEALDVLDDSPLAANAGPDDLAYVMYTSGSTGSPKGVLIGHRGLANHNLAVAKAYALGPGDRVMQAASLSFDISVEEMFPAWIAGATVVVRPGEVADAGPQFLVWIEQNRISVLNLPTALWHVWVDELERLSAELPASLRLVVVGGEAASAKAYASWLRFAGERVRWVNTYGPTEATVIATLYEPALHSGGEVLDEIPIGKPIANMQARILDGRRRPVPIGVAGELYLSGPGLARGYLNRTELTGERFMAQAFRDDSNARLYRTGDMARYRTDGNIEFLGRIDNQVKWRGFRIELGEIESALCRHEEVAQCAVLLREDRVGDKRLVAYYVPRTGAAPRSLREDLSKRLPDYMVPSAFVPVASLPLTSNGKLDRKSLLSVDVSAHGTDFEYVAPRNSVEESLCAIWSETLGVARVGIHDNFFDLGGHSLLAVRMISTIEKTMHRHVPLAALFQSPTIAQLAGYVAPPASNGPSDDPCVVATPLQAAGKRPPLIFMPPMAGNGLHWKALLSHWGKDRPVFALASSGKALPWPANASLEEIARRCIASLDKIEARTPIHLAGYSFGGKLAFEMARQLHKLGRQVGTVVIIDTGPRSVSAKAHRPRLKSLWRFLANMPFWVLDDLVRAKPARMVSEFRRKTHSWKGRLLRALGRRETSHSLENVIDVRGLPQEYVARMRVGFAAAESYVAGPYSGRVLLVRARTRPLFRPLAGDLGWREFATGRLDVMVVPGNHLSILEDPHCRELARRLQIALCDEE
jgi:aspartate racemase